MILTKQEILDEIKRGRIKITPFNKANVGPASIDLTLDNVLRVFSKTGQFVSTNSNYKEVTKLIKIDKGYNLKSGEMALGITKEKITLPDNLCGWLNSRSRYARIGLMSHITAPFVAPGISNKQVLEMYNTSPNNIMLLPKSKVCQIVLEECRGKAKYRGIWRNQKL